MIMFARFDIRLFKLVAVRILNAISLLLFSFSAFGMTLNVLNKNNSNIDIELGATANFQLGIRIEEGNLLKIEENVSANRDIFALYNDSGLYFSISHSSQYLKYGTKIILVPTSKKSGGKYNGSHIFFDTSFGKFEFGSGLNAAANMHLDACYIKSAAGNSWVKYANFSSEYMRQGSTANPSFATASEFFLDSKLVTNNKMRAYSNEPARSISYYTPKIALAVDSNTRIQIGISYIPDSTNSGADTPKIASYPLSEVINPLNAEEKFIFDRSIRDIVTGAVSLDHHFYDGCDFKITLSGEVGKSVGYGIKSNIITKEKYEYALKNLFAYNIGAFFSVGKFSCAGSYGSLGDSLTSPEFYKNVDCNTNYYTFGLSYTLGGVLANISYFGSNHFENTVNLFSIGGDYQVLPGLKPYVEISRFYLNGKPEFDSTKSPRKINGMVLVVGVKINV